MPTEEKVMEYLRISWRHSETENSAGNNQQEGSSDRFVSTDKKSECRAVLYKAVEHMENGERELAKQEYRNLPEPDYPTQLFVSVHESQHNCNFSKEAETDKADLENLSEVQLYIGEEISVKPHPLNTYQNPKPAVTFNISKAYANRSLLNAERMELTFKKKHKALGPRIKVAFVSSDIKDHSLAHLISGLFSCFNRNIFEVTVFALNSDDNSEVRNIIKNDVDIFYDVSDWPFQDQCEKVAKGEYDILVNLNGYTSGSCNELFALKLAPIQVMWLGFPGTSGADYMDYILLDKVSMPKENEQFFSEDVKYLPDSHFVGNHANLFPHLKKKVCVQMSQQSQDFVDNNIVINVVSQEPLQTHEIKKVKVSISPEIPCPGVEKTVEYESVGKAFFLKLIIRNTQSVFAKVFWWLFFWLWFPFLRLFAWKTVFSRCAQIFNSQKDLKVTARCMYGLPYGRIVFCNFCQCYKYDKRTLELWLNILRGVPDSVLWLLEWNEMAKENVLSFFSLSGIDKKRIIFTPRTKKENKEEYIRFSQLADVFLDTPLCNGHTTCLDALWAGLPVVTLPGKTLASRIAASIVTAIGCKELIAKNEEDYVRIAIELGTNKKNLQSLRARIYDNRTNCSLFNNEVFCKSLEQLFLLMVQEKMTDKSLDRSAEQLKEHFRILVTCKGNRVEAEVQNIKINTSSFRSLSKDKDVDKNLVKAYLAVLVYLAQKKSKGIYMIDPETLSNVMGDKFDGDAEILNKIETCFGELQKDIDMTKDSHKHNIIGAFHVNGNWQLLFVNLDKKGSAITVIDPVSHIAPDDQNDLRNKWSEFMRYLQRVKPDWSWTQSTFVFKQLPYKTTDSLVSCLVSCGPLCLSYAENILSQQTPSILDLNLSSIPNNIDSVNEMREKIGCDLLRESELDHICRKCSKIDLEYKVLCRNCSQHK